jgi:cobalt-zinc-cadmium efflux system outer membrane protein
MLPGRPLVRLLLIGFLVAAAARSPVVVAQAAGSCTGGVPEKLEWGTAVERLVRCNPDVRLALNQLDSARADRIVSAQLPNPQASFGAASINTQKGIRPAGQSYQVDWLARIDQLIERGGKRELRIRGADSGVTASRWQLADTMRFSLLALSHAWSELWMLQQRESVLEELLGDFRRIEQVSRTRFDAGDVSQAEWSRVVIDLQRIENERAQALFERIRAQQTLMLVLAIPPQAGELRLAGPWPALQGSIPQPDTVTVRPELAAADALLEKARVDRELARQLGTRDVVVGVQADRYPPPAGDGNTFGLYASIPLFAWHRHEGEVARAEAAYTAALLLRQQVDEQTRTQQLHALRERDVALARWRRLRDGALPLGERLSGSIRTAYEQRAIGLLDMLDTLRVHRQVQMDALDARVQFEKSDALARALLRVSPAADDPVFRFVSIPESGPER